MKPFDGPADEREITQNLEVDRLMMMVMAMVMNQSERKTAIEAMKERRKIEFRKKSNYIQICSPFSPLSHKFIRNSLHSQNKIEKRDRTRGMAWDAN
jgi:hypothetical protein